jgi:hypothetical protein
MRSCLPDLEVVLKHHYQEGDTRSKTFGLVKLPPVAPPRPLLRVTICDVPARTEQEHQGMTHNEKLFHPRSECNEGSKIFLDDHNQ